MVMMMRFLGPRNQMMRWPEMGDQTSRLGDVWAQQCWWSNLILREWNLRYWKQLWYWDIRKVSTLPYFRRASPLRWTPGLDRLHFRRPSQDVKNLSCISSPREHWSLVFSAEQSVSVSPPPLPVDTYTKLKHVSKIRWFPPCNSPKADFYWPSVVANMSCRALVRQHPAIVVEVSAAAGNKRD